MMIIKIGGGETIYLEAIIKDLATLNDKFIIVHGANAVRDNLAESLRNPKRIVTSLKGHSSVFTDEIAMDIMMMAYPGLQNKRLVELCHQHGINAIGLSGLDGKLIQGIRNTGIKTMENSRKKILRDFSGKPKEVNLNLLRLMLDNGYVPVITQPILDENNFAINSENDDVLAILEQALHADKIISLIEAPGFLDDKDDESTLVKQINKDDLELREEQVEGRMKRKIYALRKLFENGAKEVIISDGRTDHPIQDALNGNGTVIS